MNKILHSENAALVLKTLFTSHMTEALSTKPNADTVPQLITEARHKDEVKRI